MSWLGDLFGKLFGIHGGDQANAGNARGTKKTPCETVSTSSAWNGTFRKHSLGDVLSHSPEFKSESPSYDLQQPPKLSSGVLKKLRAQIEQIPVMPEIWQQVQDILQQPDSSARDLGVCVAQDPILTAHILKICNSSIYAAVGSAQVSNIPLAIARLGLDEASHIIFQALAPDLGASERNKREIRALWFHCQAIAMLSRELAEPADGVSRHEVSLIGMMHDIGKLVILHIEPEPRLEALKTAIDQGVPALAAEHEILGYSHIDAGMMLALHWKLPKHVQYFMSFHHHLTACKIEAVPDDLQYSMLVLQVSHLILQHELLPDPDNAMIWQHHQRTRMADTIPCIQQYLQTPLDSPSFYAQIQSDITRLKASFPDLF